MEFATAADADSLVRRTQTGAPTVVLIDLTMSGVDLNELLARLKATDPAPQSVMAFGPHVHRQRLDAARQAGCDRVLTRGQLHEHAAEVLGEFAE